MGEWARQIDIIYEKNAAGKGGMMICAKLIHHPRCDARAMCHSEQRESISHTLGVSTLTRNSAIRAILNTSNHHRYRDPDLIRFDTDSAYVFLLPGSDFGEHRNWIGRKSAQSCVVIDSGRVCMGGKCRDSTVCFYKSQLRHCNVHTDWKEMDSHCVLFGIRHYLH